MDTLLIQKHTIAALLYSSAETSTAVRAVCLELGLLEQCLFSTNRLALLTTCPKCGAPPHTPCSTRSGGVSVNPHKLRLVCARRQEDAYVKGRCAESEVVAGVINGVLDAGGTTTLAAARTFVLQHRLPIDLVGNQWAFSEGEVRTVLCPYCAAEPGAPCAALGKHRPRSHRQRWQNHLKTLDLISLMR